MKLSESATFKLFDKYFLPHSKVVATPFARGGLAQVVVKADLAIGGKKKLGLVQICDIKEVPSVSKKMGVPVIVEEFIEHRDEYFVALKAVREGIEVYYSGLGGIDVEENWEKVSKILVPTELLLRHSGDSGTDSQVMYREDSRIAKGKDLHGLDTNSYRYEGDSGQARMTEIEDKLFNLVAEKVVREWIANLIQFFQEEDATYLEINPFTLIQKYAGTGQVLAGRKQVVMPLGVVLVLDESAEFRHQEWAGIAGNTGISTKTEREKKVAEIDSQIKGSIKLVEVKRRVEAGNGKNRQAGDLTAMMGGGAGAALFLCDAVLENGYRLANYAEFSGNPPDFAVAELVKQICAIPGIKNLVIGSGIANFTDVYSNFQGIIQGLRESPQAKALKIVIQRLGPGEDRGMELMKEFINKSGMDIQVFDRSVPLTEIVKKLK